MVLLVSSEDLREQVSDQLQVIYEHQSNGIAPVENAEACGSQQVSFDFKVVALSKDCLSTPGRKR